MASPIKPAGSVKDEIEIFLAITNGPGKENYVYPTDRKVKGDEIALEVKKQANYLFVDKKYEEAIGYYTVASRFGQSSQIVADSIANRSACFESMKNNVAALLDCKAALSYGFGHDNESKQKKVEARISTCESNLGQEGLEKIAQNRAAVDEYEGKEIFDSDWIKVNYTKEKGHHVVAKKTIPAGTQIIEEKAEFYSSLKYENAFPGYCLNCLVKAKYPGGFIPCPYCPVAMYCSEKCREAHAVEHSIECGYMNLIQSFDEAGMLIQAIIKDTSYLELESRPERSKTFPVQQNKYQQSFCNVDFILDWTDSQKSESKTHVQCRRYIALCYHVISFLNDCKGYSLPISSNSLLRCLELLMTNTQNQLGVGDGVIRLFPNVSLINHACKRNTIYLSGGHWLKVHTTEEIGEGMEITTNYSVEENSEKRLKELKEKYGFECKCGHC